MKSNYNSKKLKNITILNKDTVIQSSVNSIVDQTLESVSITSGSINNTVIGNLFPSTAVFTNATLGNITVSFSTLSTNNNTPITIEKPLLYHTLIPVGERLNMTSSFIQPSNNFNLSMVSVSTINTPISGTLLTPSYDFFEKTILIEQLASGSSFQLNFPVNTLCTSEGCRAAQSVLFTCPGQGATFIYSQPLNCWYIKNSGGIVSYL